MKKINKQVTIALLSIFVLLIGLVAGAALVKRVQEIREGAAPAPNIIISPQTQSLEQGDPLSFTVRSDSGTYKVSSVQLFVTYDPSSFEVTSVTQGSGITGFSEFINEIDNTTGRIRYVASVLNPASSVQGSDLELIAVNGNVKASAPVGSYSLGFDTGTKILDDAGQNMYATVVPGTVQVSEPPVTVTSTPPTTTTPTSSPTPTLTTTPTPTGIIEEVDSTLYIEPALKTASLGQVFSVDVIINTGVNDVIGTELHLYYNSDIVRATDITPGSFFNSPAETIKNIDNSVGLVQYVLHIPTSADPVSGADVLATITFEALTEGTTDVTFGNRTIVAAVNVGGVNALKNTTKGTITVRRASIPGDINDMGTYCGDGVVNILDYTILYDHFWEEPSTHPCADIDENGKVNTLDYVILYENFGREL